MRRSAGFGKELIGLVRDRGLPQWQLAGDALRSWRDAQGIDDKDLTLTPEDLGVRITYLATPPITDASVPDCDFAVPFA